MEIRRQRTNFESTSPWRNLKLFFLDSKTGTFFLGYGHESHGIWNLHSRPGKVMKFEKFVSVMEKSRNFKFFPKLLLADGWKIKKFRKLCVKHKNVQPLEHFTRCFHQSSCPFWGHGIEKSWNSFSQFLCEPCFASTCIIQHVTSMEQSNWSWCPKLVSEVGVPVGNRTHVLPHMGWILWPLSHWQTCGMLDHIYEVYCCLVVLSIWQVNFWNLFLFNLLL